MVAPLEFEKDIAELESKLSDLRHASGSSEINILKDIERIEKKLHTLLASKYANLSAWEKVLVARHQERPHFLDYVHNIFTDFTPLSGDRVYGDDQAMLGGMARFQGRPVMLLGHEKGHDTESRIKHNFGMPRPEGYRKAARLMKLAERYGMPIITFIDTAGAHPGLQAEERGQAEAIAKSIDTMMSVNVPTLSVIIGEGGSGGAIAVAVGNYVMMLEHAIYSVVSPEGCASILWRSAEKKKQAAEAQKFTAQDLKTFGVIDEILKEPLGGAHRNPSYTYTTVAAHVEKALQEVEQLQVDNLREHRQDKFLSLGRVGA